MSGIPDDTRTETGSRSFARSCGARLMAAALAVAAALSLSAASPATGRSFLPPGREGVEIRRTTDGIPHLRAHDWRQLGVGIGYVQAEDALCTLAEAFVTFEGRRSWFFGADDVPARNSTFGRPKNIDLDFFFRAFADEGVAARYREQSPRELKELVEGFANGYNRYLKRARLGLASVKPADRPCLQQGWLRTITADDVYRRMFAAQIAGGYGRFVTEIANAGPARPRNAAELDAGDDPSLEEKLSHRIGMQPGIGSNALAFGREATGEAGAVLFGNPHWYWGGPDRFYQMHLTIPGRLDVAGVGFLGIPVVLIGFNQGVAWSHTVSAARRFTLFGLTLDADDPTRYRIDGATEAMTRREVGVEVRAEDGSTRRLTRTFYGTRFGPVIDLGRRSPSFAWGSANALAIGDVNAANFRVFRNFLHWNRAGSLDEFMAIQRREAAVPWVNTVAIGRGDGRVWYADIGAVPNVPDALRASCMTPLAAEFARIDPSTPVLDGSRSACGWQTDRDAAQVGAMPSRMMPWLLREDYVANMNDSYWLANARRPLEGFASVLGGERRPLGLRGRLGHRLALDLLRTQPPSAETLGLRVMREVLTPHAYSAELLKEEVLARACERPPGSAPDDAETPKDDGGGSKSAATSADIAQACDVLRRWPNTADAEDRGALLWEALWERLRKIPVGELYEVPYSHEAPLDTPRGMRADAGRIAAALAASIRDLRAKGWSLDEPVGSRRFAASGAHRHAMYGGCDPVGYFAIACPDAKGDLGPDAMANSYLQVVRFKDSGVEAYTMLAHGLDEAAVSGGSGTAPVARYARKEWLPFPFTREQIARDPALTRITLRPLTRRRTEGSSVGPRAAGRSDGLNKRFQRQSH